MPLNTVSLVSPVVTSISSVIPENLQRWTYNGLDVAAVTPTGMLDLRNSTTGALSSRSSFGTLGTKIVFYSADTANPSWGFGLQSGRLVALIDPSSAGNSFSVRTSIGGSDIIRLAGDGNLSTSFLSDPSNLGSYLSMGTGSSGISVLNRVASHIPITVRGAASQTGNLQEWQDSAGAILARVSSAGGITSNANTVLAGGLFVQGNYGGSTTMAITNNQNIIGLAITAIASQTANLQEWRNSASTVLSSINPSGFFNTPRINFTGGTSTVSALALTDGTLSFESTAGQLFSISNSLTGTIFSVNDVSGLPIIEATDLGIIKINELYGQTVFGSATPTASALTTFVARTTSTIPVVVKGITSQSANLQNWYAGDGTLGTRIGPYGELVGHNQLANGIGGTVSLTMWSVISGAASYIPIIARGAASQTADLQQWQNSAGTTIASITSSGFFYGSSLELDNFGKLTALGLYTNEVPLTVVAAASQTADLQQWQNNSLTTVAKIDVNGNFKGGVVYDINDQVGTSYTFVLSDSKAVVTLNNANNITASIPTNSTPFPIGSSITIVQYGLGQVTIQALTPGTTTILSNAVTPAAPRLRGILSSATLIKVSAEGWLAIGDIY